MAFVRIVNEDAMPANPVVVVGLASVGESAYPVVRSLLLMGIFVKAYTLFSFLCAVLLLLCVIVSGRKHWSAGYGFFACNTVC
jgi:hypothetical protein